MAKAKTVIQELIDKKRKDSQVKLPKNAEAMLREIFEHNDSVLRNSRMYISTDDAVESLAKIGFQTTRNSLYKIAKQLGRQSYARK